MHPYLPKTKADIEIPPVKPAKNVLRNNILDLVAKYNSFSVSFLTENLGTGYDRQLVIEELWYMAADGLINFDKNWKITKGTGFAAWL